MEKHLEDKLENDLTILKPFGYDLKLIRRQKGVREGKGRIDLLCSDAKNQNLIVIELKNVIADKSVFEQIMNYIEALEEIQDKKVTGLVISRGCDEEFKILIEKSNHINYLDLKDLGFD